MPLEKQHFAIRESLKQVEQRTTTLQLHTKELAKGNRQLAREIKRRQTSEEVLKLGNTCYQHLLEQSQFMQVQLRSLAHQILSEQENERREISRELHDEVVQILVGINVALAALGKAAALGTKAFHKKIASTQQLVGKFVSAVHQFARDLRPAVLDDLGLIPALQAFMKSVAARRKMRIHLTAFAGVEEMESAKRIVLYRVAQEALTNVARHAKATLVNVSIRQLDGVIRMEIHDNGKSFRVPQVLSAKTNKWLGLLGMRERVEMVGGTLIIESARGQGTTVCAKIPSPVGRERMNRNQKITVLLAEDHAVVRQGLRTLLETESHCEVVGEAQTGRAAVEMTAALIPDVILMDIAMPELNGLAATQQILAHNPKARVLILSAHSDDEYIERTTAVGAVGCLEKQTSAAIFAKAIHEVAAGRIFFSPTIAKRLTDQKRRPINRDGQTKQNRARLTSCETEVLQLVAEGQANKQIAGLLGISIKTVEKHRNT
ncbi:MAG: hybrid sensor histidine kinase/response regulator transcription factor [Candidatus Synoicihabitans palmerolidicus]|nr:hybrid sensor histidine kinase/response regulator transcription factor [Candidatus Synoicihabitans palmerolidicus]